MKMHLHLVCCLLVLAPLSTGMVQFKQSTMFDITDFYGATEVPLQHCEGGCLVYASITDEGHDYAKGLVIHDNKGGFGQSIATIAMGVQAGNSLKLPYEIAINGSYFIRNLNTADANPSDVAVYVIDRAVARAFNYEIYDASSMARPNVVPKSIVTVMGAKQFVVQADKGATNSFTARLTGPDNAQEGNDDNCTDVYHTNKFEGFEFHVNGPIVSIAFDKKNLVAIKANYNWSTSRDLAVAGFVSSPGYHGCASVDPMQVYRRLNVDFSAAEYDLKSNDKFKIIFDATTNMLSSIVFKDMTNTQRIATRGEHENFLAPMNNTQFATVSYNDCSPPYGFVARQYASKM